MDEITKGSEMSEVVLTYEEMEAERDQWRQAWHSLEQECERSKAEREFNSKEHMAHLNEIWSYITDGLGDWEYPGQIMRRAKEMSEENKHLKAQTSRLANVARISQAFAQKSYTIISSTRLVYIPLDDWNEFRDEVYKGFV